MQFFFNPLTAPDANDMLQWRYTGEYAIYNMTDEPGEEDVAFLVDPHNDYYSIRNARQEFISFCCFGADAQVPGGAYADPALDIGLGLRPDLTGRGLGTGLLEAILDFAQQRFAPACLRATIASFNLRSQRIFVKNGFSEIERFQSGHAQPREFVVVGRAWKATAKIPPTNPKR